MARVEKSVLLNTTFQYENVALPGEPANVVRSAIAVSQVGLWDEEKQEWIASNTHIVSLNELVPGDAQKIGELISFELIELAKSVDILKEQAKESVETIKTLTEANETLSVHARLMEADSKNPEQV